jgi:hypothetical protein
MKRHPIVVGIILAASVLVCGTMFAQARESLYGTWKANIANSKYSPGPAPKSNIAKWEPSGGGVTLTVDNVPATGAAEHWECTGTFDGKDNPVVGNNPDADTMAFSKIDDYTYQVVNKKAGKPTLTARIVVAKDGKTRVTTQTGTNGKGQTAAITVLYEKQ